MRYYDARYNHDEIGIAGGLYYHRSCAAKTRNAWSPAVDNDCRPHNFNHCNSRGLDGCCTDSFEVVTKPPAPENQHFI